MIRSILLSAGEASGDALAAGLAVELRSIRPDLELFGMGGPRMRDAGVELVARAPGVSGLVEVARHLPALVRTNARLADVARRRRPDLAVLVDFPDFHLRLARRLRTDGIPAVQYVGPSVWAWRPGRARGFADVFRAVLLLFSFERPAWRASGADVRVVGHPAADRRPPLAPPARSPWVALAPGSRAHEVRRHVPILLGAAERIIRRRAIRFRLFAAPGVDRADLEAAVAARGLAGRVGVEGALDPDRVRHASAAVVAAGTATLEVALAGVPMVVGYRMNPISHRLLTSMVRVPHVALPSLVAGRAVAPELLQGDFRPGEVAAHVEVALDDPAARARAHHDATEISRLLGPPAASRRAAEAVLDLAEGTR